MPRPSPQESTAWKRQCAVEIKHLVLFGHQQRSTTPAAIRFRRRFGAILKTMPGYDLLIVDDDQSMQALVQAMLKGTPWNCESADSGEESMSGAIKMLD